MSPMRKNTKAKTAPESLRKPVATRPDEMAEDVLEFITAIDDYKRKHEKPFPTWSEVFEIFRDLGYERAG